MNPFVREINFTVPQRIRTDSQRACGGDVGRAARVDEGHIQRRPTLHLSTPSTVDGFPIRLVGINGGIPRRNN